MSKSSLGLIIGFVVVILIALLISSQSNNSEPLTPAPSSPISADSSSTSSANLTSTNGTPSNLPVLKDPMLAFVDILKWWNTPNGQPLIPEQLKGKVVLVDFWTYSCINCIRTQPVLRKWWDTYEKDGLVIVGVHTPEFAFEKDAKNVEQAFQKAHLRYPIALDADYGTWNAYQNHYWPAEYLFDRQGYLRYTHFGEGSYDKTEAAIRSLLAEGGRVSEAASTPDLTPDFNKIKTAETYFGSVRASKWDNPGSVTLNAEQTFKKRNPPLHHWNLGGRWMVNEEYSETKAAGSTFRMRVQADAMHLVLASGNGKPVRLTVLIDGKTPAQNQLTPEIKLENNKATLTVTESKLYRIARFPEAGQHLVELQALDPGIQFYAATFGEMKDQ